MNKSLKNKVKEEDERDEQVEGVSREAKSWHDLPYYSVCILMWVQMRK